MNNDVIFAKDPKTGHYRYMKKSEFNKGHRAWGFFGFLFYVVIFFIFIGVGYYFYTDIYDVYLVKDEVELDSGSTYQVELLPINAKYFDYKNYVYETSNPGVASIDRFGQITALNNGNADITVRYKYGIEKKRMRVSVTNIDVSNIVADENITINKNESKKVKAIVNNNDKVNTDLYYESSNTDVVKVDKYGNMTGVSEGESVVTISSSNGTKSQINVKVVGSKESIQDIEIINSNISLHVDDKQKLELEIVPSNASIKNIEFSSSDKSVATVSSKGVVTAKKEGVAIITAKTKNGLESQCVVSVVENKILLLDIYSEELNVKEQLKLTANMRVTWSSSNPSVATVGSNGIVTAKSKGDVLITAKSSDGQTTECYINVIDDSGDLSFNNDSVIPVIGSSTSNTNIKKVIVKNKEITVTKGKSKKVEVEIEPTITSDKLLYSSNSSTIAKVDSNGNVTGVKKGSTKIIIYAESNNYIKNEVLVNVVESSTTLTELSLNKSNTKVFIGNTTTLTPIFIPTNASNKTLTWTSNNENVATVDSNGKIKGIKAGTATITATSSNGLKATCKVTVEADNITVNKITIDSNVVNLDIGSSAYLNTTISPSNATNKKITWTSSDERIATVNSSGKVVGIKEGSVKITATSQSNPKVSATKSIVIRKKQETKTYNVYMGLNEQYDTNLGSVKDSTNSKNEVSVINSKGIISSKAIGKNKITVIKEDSKVSTKNIYNVYVSKDRVHVINLGLSGQSILIESNGKYALIDAGGSNGETKRISVTPTIDSCNNHLYEYLRKMGVKELEFVILSHIHYDHVACLAGFDSSEKGFLLDSNPKLKINIKKIIMKKYNALDAGDNSPKYNAIINKATKKGVKVVLLSKDTTYTLGNFTLKLFNTAEAFKTKESFNNENSNSIVTVLSKNNKMLTYISSDIQNNEKNKTDDKTAKQITNEYGRNFDIFFAGHHGYESANSEKVIGNKDKDGYISFKNVIIPNNANWLCYDRAKKDTNGKIRKENGVYLGTSPTISNFYWNLKKTNKKQDNAIYFSGEKAVIIDYSHDKVKISGGTKLNCGPNNLPCDTATKAFRSLKEISPYCSKTEYPTSIK